MYALWYKIAFGRGDEVLRNQHLLQILDASLQLCPDVVDSERYVLRLCALASAIYPY